MRWSKANRYSLTLEADGHPAFIPTDKRWWAERGYVLIIFSPHEENVEDILPSAYFPAIEQLGIGEHILENCVRCPKLLQYLFDLHQALSTVGTFENNNLIDQGPIYIET